MISSSLDAANKYDFKALADIASVVLWLAVAEEQFLLNRLANSAIDIYAMVGVLSRASRALEQNLVSARHESMLAKVICDEVTLPTVVAAALNLILCYNNSFASFSLTFVLLLTKISGRLCSFELVLCKCSCCCRLKYKPFQKMQCE